MKKWAKNIHEDIAMILVMERMWRSYEQYINTPARIIDLILQKFNTDDRHSKNG